MNEGYVGNKGSFIEYHEEKRKKANEEQRKKIEKEKTVKELSIEDIKISEDVKESIREKINLETDDRLVSDVFYELTNDLKLKVVCYIQEDAVSEIAGNEVKEVYEYSFFIDDEWSVDLKMEDLVIDESKMNILKFKVNQYFAEQYNKMGSKDWSGYDFTQDKRYSERVEIINGKIQVKSVFMENPMGTPITRITYLSEDTYSFK